VEVASPWACRTGLEAAIRAARSDGALLASDTAAIAAARGLAMCLDQATSPPAANETGIANLTREYRSSSTPWA